MRLVPWLGCEWHPQRVLTCTACRILVRSGAKPQLLTEEQYHEKKERRHDW